MTHACSSCGSPETRALRTVNGFSLLQCGACSLIFVPASELVDVDYDAFYKPQGDYSTKLNTAERLKAGEVPKYVKSKRTALAELTKRPPRKLLEIGCGVGDFLASAERLGVKCFGTDLSEGAIEQARQHLKAQLIVGDVTPESFAGETFDAACAWEVLEHIATPLAFLQRIVGRLEPGGRLYLSTPNYESRWLLRDMENDPRGRPPVHVTYWTEKSLRQVLSAAGLGEIRIRWCSIPSNAAWRLNGRLGSWSAVAESFVRPRQRRTLLASAVKP